ncbi:MAG TPA: ABC transporter ATP-binding protein [Terracidiphilus sp.]|nr:ABC transporter ATP-binding protein [Terracidiphilus sp.]
MTETLKYARTRLRRLGQELRFLPRTLRIVREASGNRTLGLWVFLLIVQGLLPLAIVYLTRTIVNLLVIAVHSGGQWNVIRPVIVAGCWFAAVLLISQLLRGLTAWARMALSEVVRDHLARLIQMKSLEVDLAFYDSSDFYDHLHRARMEAPHRPVELLEGLGSLFQGAITFVSILAVLVPFGALPVSSLILSTVPVLYVVVRTAQRRHQWNEASTIDTRRTWYFDTVMTDGQSAAEMRLLNLGGHFLESFQTIRYRLRQGRLQLAKDENVSELWAAALAMLILGGATVWMVRRAIYGMVSLGDLAMFFQAFNQGFGLSRTILDNLGKLYENCLFIGNLFEFFDLRPQIISPPNPRPMPPSLAGAIRFCGVTFRYPGTSRQILSNLSLEIQPGQMVALVGENGTGKSTFIKLLCRFYDPDSGSIQIDGIPLKEISIAGLRRSISVFFQQPMHFNDTVAANVRFGDLGIADSEFPGALERCAEMSGLAEIVARLPGSYDTLLGRDFFDGAELSVGEWHRVALVRASIRKARILILDEPTSAMDPWAELNWATRLRELAEGRTVILNTHRFTTAMFADVIHVISDGRVVESGNHAALLAKGGIYARGWSSQAVP